MVQRLHTVGGGPLGTPVREEWGVASGANRARPGAAVVSGVVHTWRSENVFFSTFRVFYSTFRAFTALLEPFTAFVEHFSALLEPFTAL